MDYWAFQKRIVEIIDELLSRRADAHGGLKGIREKIGVTSESFFRDLRRNRNRMPMDKVFAVIELLGEHPMEVLYRAARDVDPRLPEIPPLIASADDLPEGHLVREILATADRGRR